MVDDTQQRQWHTIFAGHEYFYGGEPGPLARRAVTYHRRLRSDGGAAFDAGCGEGQDLAFLAEQGYSATGLEFTATGAAKARRMLAARSLAAEVLETDLSTHMFTRRYDLVLAVNVVQFLGDAASTCLDRLIGAVASGGVLGLSLFAPADSGVDGQPSFFTITLPNLLARFAPDAGHGEWQMLEAAQLWQWRPRTLHALPADRPQAFVTLIAQRVSD